jgi:flagellar protein FlbB
MLKILFLGLLIIVIILGGIFWFDRLGILDYKRVAGPLAQYLPAFMQRGEEVEEDPLLLDREMLNKREEILEARTRELDLRVREFEERENMLNEREAKLVEEAKRLEEQEKVLSEEKRQYDNYKDNIRKQAEYFTSMPPGAAVDRLQKLDDLLVIDVLREVDRQAEETGTVSLVPYYLSLMDEDKAASVQRKMTKIGDFEEQ